MYVFGIHMYQSIGVGMKPNVPHGHFDGIGIVSSAAVACAVGACLLVPRVAYAQARLTNHLMGNSSEISRFYPVFSDNRAPQRNIPENQVPENLRIVPNQVNVSNILKLKHRHTIILWQRLIILETLIQQRPL